MEGGEDYAERVNENAKNAAGFDESRMYLLAWSRVRGVGPGSVSRLRRHFGALTEAWRADQRELRASGLRPDAVSETLKTREKLHIEEEVASLARRGIGWTTLADSDYPELLKKIANPPLVLYWRGVEARWPEFALAIVGTRKASRDGLQAARELAGAIADAGYTIISGLAQGIDAAVHEAALETRGSTLAVLGSGVEEIYPARNRGLAERIMERGMIISEFAPKVKPTPGNFPHRNRIISGLSLGVLVAEAPSRSGALNTAQHAADQGREVFAVPQHIHSQSGKGCNDLLADGACIARHAEDVLSVLRGNTMVGERFRSAPKIATDRDEATMEMAPSAPPLLLSENEATVLAQLGAASQHVDDIAQGSGLPIATVSSALTLLEIKGLVELVGAMQYRQLDGRGGRRP